MGGPTKSARNLLLARAADGVSQADQQQEEREELDLPEQEVDHPLHEHRHEGAERADGPARPHGALDAGARARRPPEPRYGAARQPEEPEEAERTEREVALEE